MSTNALLRNRHPADLLADTRAEIKQLEIQEAELRQHLLTNGADRRGVQWEVAVRKYDQDRIDTKALVEHFGHAAIAPFLKQVEVQALMLRRRKRRTANSEQVQRTYTP
jgi:hypothetical protein